MSEIPIFSLKSFGDAPYFIFCDHASNAMPASMNCLGISDDVLRTHIAWDIGAGALSSALARELAGTVFQCEFSRLIIDANRCLTSKDLIPATSDLIPVPGNQMLNDVERTARIEKYHEPYHRELSKALDGMYSAHKDFFAVSVHTFTRRLMGASNDRPWTVGMLWSEDEQSARKMIDYVRRAADWAVGDNEPYDAREFNYSVDRHVGPRNLRHLTFEVRQDMLSNDRDIGQVAAVLADGIRIVANFESDGG